MEFINFPIVALGAALIVPDRRHDLCHHAARQPALA